jgi:hypothetical protein
VEVEVDEADAVGSLRVAGDRADPDRAVAAQDEGDLSGEDRLDDSRRRVVDDLDHLAEVLGVRALAVRAPAPGLAIAVVGDLDPAVTEQRDQACAPQRFGRLLLAGREGARAGRDADHTHPAAVAHHETH